MINAYSLYMTLSTRRNIINIRRYNIIDNTNKSNLTKQTLTKLSLGGYIFKWLGGKSILSAGYMHTYSLRTCMGSLGH